MDETGHTYWAVKEGDRWVCFAVDADVPNPEEHWPHLPVDAEHHQVDRFSQCVDETYDGSSGWMKCVKLIRASLIKEAAVLRAEAVQNEPDYADCETEDDVLDAMLRHRAKCFFDYKNTVKALQEATSHEELIAAVSPNSALAADVATEESSNAS